MNTAQWIKEAEEQARKYSDSIKNNSQYLLDQLNASKTNTLNLLQSKQNNALYNLNTNQSTINKAAEDSARQANINRLLALKSNEQAMNRAGLGSQGLVGSQVNSINNNYGTNLTSILNEKNNELNNLAKQRNDLNTQYDVKRLNLENEYDGNIANLQSQIDDKALNQYNNVYNNYLSYLQQQYDNKQAEKAAEEAVRQFNENLAFQKAQVEQEQKNWEKQYALSKAKTYNSTKTYNFNDSGGNGNNSNNNFSDNKTNETNTSSNEIVNRRASVKMSSTSAQKFSNGLKTSYNKDELVSQLTDAYKKALINDDDLKLILWSYGLS